MGYRDQRSVELLAEAAKGGLSESEMSEWRRDLDSAALALCGCKPAAIAAALSTITSVGLILAFAEARSVKAIAAAAATTIAITVAAKFFGYRAAERRLAELQEMLQARVRTWQ